jgi:hypothetical protein
VWIDRRGSSFRRSTAVLVASVLAISTAAGGPVARADVPEAGDDEAVVQLFVGDTRGEPDEIDPIAPGAVFGLFLSDPSASIRENDGFADITSPNPAPLFTCESDADGDCVFTVPIRPGAPGTDGVAQGTRLWAAAISAPPGDVGYYANPFWQTAPLANTNQASLRHVFQTPALVGGQEYLAGRDWISDPGLQTDPASTVPEYTKRIASGGVTPLSRFNNDLPDHCGLNVALIVDVSSSVGQAGAADDLIAAMDAFVDALHGTPSRVALFTFGTDSPAGGYDPNTGLRSVATTADATAFKNLYAGWDDRPWPTNYTNWDRGFAAAAEVNQPTPDTPPQFDLGVFLTDGNPTVYGPDPLTTGPRPVPIDPNSGYTRFRELGNGLASANLLKSQGTRIIAVGVGTGVSGAGSEYNLRTISGLDRYEPGATSSGRTTSRPRTTSRQGRRCTTSF